MQKLVCLFFAPIPMGSLQLELLAEKCLTFSETRRLIGMPQLTNSLGPFDAEISHCLRAGQTA